MTAAIGDRGLRSLEGHSKRLSHMALGACMLEVKDELKNDKVKRYEVRRREAR